MTGLGPALPANWYLLGPSKRLKPGSVAHFDIGDRAVVVWRSKSGVARAFGGACAHMGCHLGGATVVGEALRCPLHHRLIEGDGSFRGHATLSQPVLPLTESFGGLFVGLSPPGGVVDGLFDHDGFATCYAGEHRFPLAWQALVANGFDVEHLSSVHERTLLAPPTLLPTDSGAMQLRYLTRAEGRGWSDRLMRRLAPDGVDGTITAFRGSLMLVESRLAKRRSFILLSFVPDVGGATVIRGIVGVKARRFGAVQARAAAALFKSFLAKDLGVLDKLAWHEPAPSPAPGDRFTRALCDYFRGLPHA